MILKASFGTFTPPQIAGEALRQTIRELRSLNYDVDELITFFTQVLANPDTWINNPQQSFALHQFFEAYHGDRRNDGNTG